MSEAQRGRGQTEHEFYEDALKTAERGWQATGYGMEINQRMRFDEFRKQLLTFDTHYSSGEFSLLDIGCGTGDLLTYLQRYDLLPERYVGIDPMKEMVERTQGTIDACIDDGVMEAEVFHGTIRDYWNSGSLADQGGPFDYAVSIAAYALKKPEQPMMWAMEQVLDDIATTMKCVRKAAFFTLFSSYKTEIIPEEMVLDPATMFVMLKAEYERVDLIHSYAPFDFSVVVYKEDSLWREEWNRMHGKSILRVQ